MPSSDASSAPQRAERLRERVSLLLMLLPLAVALAFVLLTPSVWSTDLAVTFTEDNELAGTAAGWIVAALALGAALLCAWIGAQGTREQWKYNRRWQRGVLAAAAAGLTTVLLSTWAMTEALREGRDPNVGLVLFVTVCALLYGAACAAVTPRDLVDTRYA